MAQGDGLAGVEAKSMGGGEAKRIADCGLRIADCRRTRTQSAILNPQSAMGTADA
jgi:hypothetical protein